MFGLRKMTSEDDFGWKKALWAADGNKVAYFLLLSVLYKKGLIDSSDLDFIEFELTDMGGQYEMKPYPRASIEKMATAFKRMRPDRKMS